MLAEIAAVCGHGGDAERLLRKALDSAPGFVPLHVNLATLLQDLGRTEEAIALLDDVLANAPGNSMVLSFKAEILVGAGRMHEALKTHEDLLALAPDAAIAWMNYGHALKIAGRAGESASAYRRSLRLDPTSGFAWWGLANLRTTKLDRRDIAAMQAALAGAGDDLNRMQIHFALGKALGDQDSFEESFSQYATANEIRRAVIPYDPNRATETVRKAEALLTQEFLSIRAGQGCAASAPIFIVGLPRSGSTLVEQILASHPLVEGAGELPDIERIATGIADRRGAACWLDAIGEMSADSLRALGEAYLGATRAYRKTDHLFFSQTRCRSTGPTSGSST
jgi:tetratricopeptide (TPR) repeat protein